MSFSKSFPTKPKALYHLLRFLSIAFLYIIGFLILLVATFAIFGVAPSKALFALQQGAFGGGSISPAYALSETLVRATPLLLTGLSIVVAWQAGMFSIGGDGQLLMGALTATVLAQLQQVVNPNLLILLMLVCGTLVGGLWGAIAGWLRVKRNVQEVISTIMLNYIALYLVGAAVVGPLQESSHSNPESNLLPDKLLFAHILPPSWSGGVTTRLHSGVFLAFLAVPIVWLYLYRTLPGFHLRIVGQNPDAARATGVLVDRIRVRAMAFSGALCGLAGVVQLLGTSERLSANFSPGWGYTAIPVALVGGLHPIGTLLSALFFGALEAGSVNAEQTLQVPASLIAIVQAAAVLAIIGVNAWRQRYPTELKD
ncbi:nucleoside ABC transporter membrane protein [Chthonomonas calidirosea]|uniref:ABC transporter permease n=1 Tax=Chthonomonas calidirosea TaxID=454171 RepID=UPI0006DD4CDB|nr:ABC transporter permease [Chthonomonas calidirosea]CEK15131.1 nucleoside ABC transporter membrane protein [Chthonomonas calidirosea]